MHHTSRSTCEELCVRALVAACKYFYGESAGTACQVAKRGLMATLETLPKDVLLFIFQLLDGRSLLRLGCCSRHLRQIACNDLLWRRMTGREWVFFPTGLNIGEDEEVTKGTRKAASERGAMLERLKKPPPFILDQPVPRCGVSPCVGLF